MVRSTDHSTSFYDQHIVLTGHLLILAVRGEVVVEAFDSTVLMRPGDALMLGECEARISEAGSGVSGCAEVCYFLFDHRVVGREVGSSVEVESLCWIDSAPDSYFQRVREFVPHIMSCAHAGQLVFPRDLSRILRILVNCHVPASFFSILRRTYFQPRAWLSAFVERYVLGNSTIERIARDYPLGRAEFFRQFAKYHIQSPEDWLRRRRMELARLWLGYGDVKLDDVASALGYKKKADFHRDAPGPLSERLEKIKRVGSQADLSATEVQRLARPFWVPPTAADLLRACPPTVILTPAEIEDIPPVETPAFIRELFPEPAEPSKAAIQDFWAMKTTGVGTIVPLPAWISEDVKLAA